MQTVALKQKKVAQINSAKNLINKSNRCIKSVELYKR